MEISLSSTSANSFTCTHGHGRQLLYTLTGGAFLCQLYSPFTDVHKHLSVHALHLALCGGSGSLSIQHLMHKVI